MRVVATTELAKAKATGGKRAGIYGEGASVKFGATGLLPLSAGGKTR